MGKFLKKFEEHSTYETYINGSSRILPNVSYCVDANDVHYNPCPIIINVYNVTDDTQMTKIFNAATNVSLIEIDGDEVDKSEIQNGQYQLSNGEHTVMYTLTNRKNVENNAFNGCTTLVKTKIPNSVTTIGNSAFFGCTGLTGIGRLGTNSSVQLPDGVTSIGERAFQGCTGLTSLKLPKQLKKISYRAFRDCSGLTGSLVIPNGVTSIDGDAFFGCSGFNGTLTIPNSVAKIEFAAFLNCSGFNGTLTIPNSVTSIGNSAFYNCSGFTGSLTIPSSITSINNSTFAYCSGLTSVTISDTVTTIGNEAFFGCTNLTNISFGNGVTSIGNSAFGNCNSLQHLVIPDNVVSIGENAFTMYRSSNNRNNLVSVRIGKGLQTLGRLAFSQLTPYLESIIIDEENPYFDSRNNCNAIINTTSNTLIKGCMNTTVIPNGIVSINEYAFYYCSGLVGVTIPDSVTTIGNLAFNRSQISGVISLNNIITIGQSAFNGCQKIREIIIGDSITTISNDAFYQCHSTQKATIYATTPPTLGSNAFRFTIGSGYPIYVPTESVEAYKSATNWNSLASRIFPIPSE